ncbi:hypothetical protein [Asticcacaulis solisilvae]|uniref:hypothetical protein n=1 Tax=Asticcacaulis solisilvae TaxID=1217274 RepID=UPI003FD8D237
MKRWTFAVTAATVVIALAACQKAPAPAPAQGGDTLSSASPLSLSAAASETASSEWTGASAPPMPAHVTPVPAAFRGLWGEGDEGCLDGLQIDAGSISYGEDDDTVRAITVVSPTHIRILADHYGEATGDLPPGASTYAGPVTYDLTLRDGGDSLKQVTKDGSVITYSRCITESEASKAAQ